MPSEPIDPVLRVRNLRKSFTAHLSLGRTQVLDGVTFEVRRGEIYGLLGPNGAGKTTILKTIVGLLRPGSGEVTLFGRPPRDPASRRRVGFLPENPYFYDYLTPREFLDFYARLLSVPRVSRPSAIEGLLARVGMTAAADRPLRKLSKGMVQRVGMAQALIGEPELVILDEPMSGLDPIGRREFRDIILSLRAAGRTVLFSSHILQDAEMICDRVGILKKGTLVREGPLAALLETGDAAYEVTLSGHAPLGDGWRPIQGRGSDILLHVDGPDALERLLAALPASGARVVSVAPIRMSLEDLFLKEISAGSAPAPRGSFVGAGGVR